MYLVFFVYNFRKKCSEISHNHKKIKDKRGKKVIFPALKNFPAHSLIMFCYACMK